MKKLLLVPFVFAFNLCFAINDTSFITDRGYGLSKEQLPEAYNASARFEMSNEWGFFTSASLIYWSAIEDGLDVAINYPSTLNAENTDAKVENMKCRYKCGFKAGIGIIFDKHDDWLLGFEYTRFTAKVHKRATPMEVGGSLSPSWQNVSSATYARGKWSFNYNLFDGLFFRPCYFGTYLTLNPFCGLKGGWLKQHYKATYYTDEYPIYPNAKQRNWLIGPKAGIDCNWLVGGGIRIFIAAAGSLLYENFKVRYQSTEPSSFIGAQKEAVTNDFNFMAPNVEAGLGIGWGSYFSNNGWHFDFKIGYDFQIYWNQNGMRALKDRFEDYLIYDHQNFDRGNLTLQGLTATLRFDF